MSHVSLADKLLNTYLIEVFDVFPILVYFFSCHFSRSLTKKQTNKQAKTTDLSEF